MNKEQIDEIAMRVWNESESECDSRTGRGIITDFTHALLAELAKVHDPVAIKAETNQFDCFHVSFEDSERLKSLPVGTKLYTQPLPQPDLVAEIEHLKRSRENFAQSSEHSLQQLSEAQANAGELLKALEVAADQIRKCDYTPARSTLLQAIAAHKARKEKP